MKPLTTPILLIVFNRPDTAARVFAEIRKAGPTKLYIAADGPRARVASDPEACRRTRDVVSKVDWPCEVRHLFRDANLGCRLGASGAVTWFFENEPEGIVLEDDCLPDQSFFTYCQELLERYRNDQRIMMIAGVNLLLEPRQNQYSYHFSRYPHLWGWASWRRAWSQYDIDMRLWPETRDSGLMRRLFETRQEAEYWSRWIQRVYDGKIDTWDFQWNLVNWLQSGLTLIPSVNLISNIGFLPGATHTLDTNSKYAALPRVAMDAELKHPPYVARDITADRQVFHDHFLTPLPVRVRRKMKRVCHRLSLFLLGRCT